MPLPQIISTYSMSWLDLVHRIANYLICRRMWILRQTSLECHQISWMWFLTICTSLQACRMWAELMIFPMVKSTQSLYSTLKTMSLSTQLTPRITKMATISPSSITWTTTQKIRLQPGLSRCFFPMVLQVTTQSKEVATWDSQFPFKVRLFNIEHSRAA